MHDFAPTRLFTTVVRTTLLGIVLGHGVLAQCETSWLPGESYLGIDTGGNGNGPYTVAEWDPDGAGPANPLVVVGGSFEVAGPHVAPGVAAFDPATGTWSQLGTNFDYMTVHAFATLPNGNLVAGGAFWLHGVGPTLVAEFDGTSWSSLGGPDSGQVEALLVTQNGDLVVGGFFGTVGGIPMPAIARWDGSSWSPLGAGLNFAFGHGNVRALVELPNGDVVAGGTFYAGPSQSYVAIFNGTSWAAHGQLDDNVRDLRLLSNGRLIAVGDFSVGSVGGVATFNGAGWTGLGTGFTNDVWAVLELPNGDIVVGGEFNSSGTGPMEGVARWNGTAWSAFSPQQLGTVRGLALSPNGDLLAAGGVPGRIARWNGAAWEALGSGWSGTIYDVLDRGNGRLVAGGDFTVVQGATTFANVAEWDGTSWGPLGAGIDGQIEALAALPNGDLVAAGRFTTAGGNPVNNIARWDGSAWQPLGGGLTDPTNVNVKALAVLPNGNLVAGGWFTMAGGVAVNNIAQWDGTSWSPLGAGVTGSMSGFPRVEKLLLLPNGDLVAGGLFTTAGTATVHHIARWDGTSWSPYGAGFDYFISSVRLLATAPNGDLLAGGTLWTAGGVYLGALARWNGTSWSAFGSGSYSGIHDMMQLPGGDLLAAGSFPFLGGFPVEDVARWDGATWSQVGGALNRGALAVTMFGTQLVAGGQFSRAGDVATALVGFLETSCEPVVTATGTPCTSSVGPMNLTADTMPWTGETFRATATGIVPNGLVAGLFGLATPGTGLAAIHPAGVPGCDLLARPDAVQLLLGGSPTVETFFAIPNDPVFAGVMVQSQVLQAELGPANQITRLAGTNGLSVTVGVF